MTSEEQARVLRLALDRLKDEPVIELTKEMEIRPTSRATGLLIALLVGFVVTLIFRLG